MKEIRSLLNEYDNIWFYVSEQYQDQFYNELKLMDAHFLNGSKLAPESIGNIVGVHSDGTIGCVSYFVWYNSFFSTSTPIKIDYEKFCVGKDDYVITVPNILPA